MRFPDFETSYSSWVRQKGVNFSLVFEDLWNFLNWNWNNFIILK